MALIDRDVVTLMDDALHSKLHGYLRGRGWKLHRAANADELAALFEQQDFHAGLLNCSASATTGCLIWWDDTNPCNGLR